MARPDISCKEAVWATLDKIGDQSSIPTLQKEAQKRTCNPITTANTYQIRRAWRRTKGKHTDARTYKGQPERNMTRATAGLNLKLGDIPRAVQMLRRRKIDPDGLMGFFNAMGGARQAHEVVVGITQLARLGFDIAA
jgi:hypothetical protein